MSAQRIIRRRIGAQWQSERRLIADAIVRLARTPEYADLIADLNAELETLGATFTLLEQRSVAA